jgi:hypothetical protein
MIGYQSISTLKAKIDHFREIFPFYDLDFNKWCVCLIGDNAAVNIKTATLCGKPHVGCKNHKLNLQVNSIFLENEELNSAIEDIRESMVQLKTMKNSAALRNLMDIRPGLFVPTRWSGKFYGH